MCHVPCVWGFTSLKRASALGAVDSWWNGFTLLSLSLLTSIGERNEVRLWEIRSHFRSACHHFRSYSIKGSLGRGTSLLLLTSTASPGKEIKENTPAGPAAETISKNWRRRQDILYLGPETQTMVLPFHHTACSDRREEDARSHHQQPADKTRQPICTTTTDHNQGILKFIPPELLSPRRKPLSSEWKKVIKEVKWQWGRPSKDSIHFSLNKNFIMGRRERSDCETGN